MNDFVYIIAIGGRFWRSPGTEIDLDSDFEWCTDGDSPCKMASGTQWRALK